MRPLHIPRPAESSGRVPTITAAPRARAPLQRGTEPNHRRGRSQTRCGRTRVGFAEVGFGAELGQRPDGGPKPINARADSLFKTTFRDAFQSKHCLIPANGFYEWAMVGSRKRSTHFRMKDRSLFAFAGLWEFWTDGTEKLVTCCIITPDANELVGTIHNRMPVIVREPPAPAA